jgi:hypothetical protein
MSSSRATLFLIGVGLALLLAAAGLPWVTFDPPAERAGRLEYLETMAADLSLPPLIRDRLAELGIQPGMSAERLWSLLGQDEYAANFDFVRQHERLFSWDLLRLQSSWLVRGLVVGVYAGVALAVALLLLAARGAGGLPARLAGVAMGFFAVVLLLALVVTPSLDTFGHIGARGPGWLDALSGARATAAPRALLPLALLLLLAMVALIQALAPAAAGPEASGTLWPLDE